MPQTPPPEIPIVSFPTPQMVDRVLVEEHDRRRSEYKVIHPGQSHPNSRDYPNFVFLTERPSRAEGWVQRFYVNARSNQDTYNYSISYADEAVSTPIFVRSYFERRETYAALTKLSTLTGVVGAKVTNGGSGYLSSPTVGFSGGAGSGAAAIALVYRGAVVGVVVTAEGTGYTSAPAIALTPTNGGINAAATALIQPTTAKLVYEKADRMEGDIHESLFLRVTRAYQTLPGVEVIGKGYDDRGALNAFYEQTVVTGTAADVPALLDTASEVIAKDSVLSKRRKKTMAAVSTHTSYRLRPGGSLVKRVDTFPVDPATLPAPADMVIKDVVEAIKNWQSRRITETLVAANGTALAEDEGYTVSKFDPLRQVWIYTTFKWVAAGTIGPTRGSVYLTGYVNDSWTKEGDLTDKVILGVEWTTIPLPRSELKPYGVQLPRIISFTELIVDPDDPFPPPYYGNGIDFNTVGVIRHRQLSLPAKVIYTYHYGQMAPMPRADRVISFSSKWIPIQDNTIHPAIEVTRSDNGGVIESVPASSPPSYDPNDVFVGAGWQTHWMSNIWERAVPLYSENTDPTQFAQFYAGVIFVATQQNDILVQPKKEGEILYLRSDSGSEATVVTIYGRYKGLLKEKTLTLSGTTELSTDPKEFDRVRHLRAHDDPEGIITLRGGGTAAVGYAEFTGVPADGDTLIVGKTGTQRTYTFRRPGLGTFVCLAKASYVDNSGAAMDYGDVTLNAIVNRFAFDRAGTGANPPANPGTLTIVDISGATTATDVGDLYAPAIQTITTLYAVNGSGTVTVLPLFLGTFAVSEVVADAGFTATTNNAGTAIAANQIRTTIGYTILATPTPATWAEEAMNADADSSGKAYSAATAIHADVTAEVDVDNTGLVRMDDKTHAPESQAWTLSETGTAITVTAFIAGADGPIIAQLNPANATPYNRHAYKDVILSAPEILDGAPENATPNVPANVNLTSDPLLSPVASGLKLKLAARGGPPLPASYQVLKNATVTITIASPGVVSWTAHGLVNTNEVSFATTGLLPTGLTAGTTYYVVNKTADNFQVAATEGGAAINTSGSQSGVHTASAWDDGAVTLPNLGGSNVYVITLTETGVGYIRVKINNLAGEEGRAAHAELQFQIL